MSSTTATGRIVAVSENPLGDVTTEALLAGATVLPLKGTSDFTEDGGILAFTLDDDVERVAQYLTVDPDAETVTLAAPLAVAVPADTFIATYPYGYEKRALVIIDEQDKPAAATVAQGIYDKVPEGVRDADAQEGVTISCDDSGEWTVTEVHGLRLEVDGTLVAVRGGVLPVYDDAGVLRTIIGVQDDGSFTVIDVNGPAPQAPAAPTVEGGAGVLVVSTYALTADASDWPLDFRRLDVHVSTSSGFTPSLATKVAEVGLEGGSFTFALDPGTYYAKLVAVNTSGVKGAASAQGSATVTDVATGEGGFAEYYADGPPSGLGVGDAATWYDTNNGNRKHRWDGDSWEPVYIGPEATVETILAGKRVPIENAMSLEWGVPDPTAAVTPVQEWELIEEGWRTYDVSGAGDYGGSSLVFDAGVYYSLEVRTATFSDGSTSRPGLAFYLVGSDGTRSLLFNRRTPVPSLVGGTALSKIGTEWVVTWGEYVADNRSATFCRRFSSALVQVGSQWKVDEASRYPLAACANGSALQLLRYDHATAQYRIEQRAVADGALSSTVTVSAATLGGAPLSVQFDRDVSMLRGTFDFAATRILIKQPGAVYSLTTAGAAQSGESFAPRGSLSGSAVGLAWNSTLARFVAGLAGYTLRKSSNHTTTGTVWVSYAWEDSVSGDETAAAPVSTVGVTVDRRSGLALPATALPPDTDESPAPNRASIYTKTAASQPALSELRKATSYYLAPQRLAPDRPFTPTPFAVGASAPPIATDFSGGDSGILEAELGGFVVRGDGTGDWPALRRLVAEELKTVFASTSHAHEYLSITEAAKLAARIAWLEENRPQTGRATVTIPAGTNPQHGTLAVVFDREFESADVHVTANVYNVTNTGNFGVGIDAVSATGFTVRVSRLGASATSVDVEWVAVLDA